jgi:hypothetical protein
MCVTQTLGVKNSNRWGSCEMFSIVSYEINDKDHFCIQRMVESPSSSLLPKNESFSIGLACGRK